MKKELYADKDAVTKQFLLSRIKELQEMNLDLISKNFTLEYALIRIRDRNDWLEDRYENSK